MDYPNKATRKFVESIVGVESIPVSLMAIVGYLDAETGDQAMAFVNFTADISPYVALGMLELARDDLKGASKVGPHDPYWSEPHEDEL